MIKYLVILTVLSVVALAKDKESPPVNPNKQVCVDKKEKSGKQGDGPATVTKGTDCTPAQPSAPQKTKVEKI